MDRILGIPEDEYEYEFMVVTKISNGDYMWHSNHEDVTAYDVVKTVPNGVVVHNVRIKHKQLKHPEKLNKEIAKIPVMSSDYTYSGEPIYYCPTCGDTWNVNEFYPKYCWECGQKLNWEGIGL